MLDKNWVFFFFGVLLFIGFITGNNILESVLTIIGVFAIGFIMVGVVIGLIYISE